MQRRGVRAEAAPVGIGFLGDNLAFLHQPFEHAFDIEPITAALKPQGQVFEVNENRQRVLAVLHNRAFRNTGRRYAYSLATPHSGWYVNSRAQSSWLRG